MRRTHAGAIACAAIGWIGAATAMGAEVVAHWNFNGFDPAAGSVQATVGMGTIDFSGFGAGANSYAGTTLNGLSGGTAGESLGLAGMAYNGRYAQLEFETGGASDLALSFATRRSATGFANDRIDAWLDGGWTTIATFNPSSTDWGVVSVNLALAGLVREGAVALRIHFDGATSSSGNVRIDNLTVTGTAVPAPGAIAALALVGIGAGRRRRA